MVVVVCLFVFFQKIFLRNSLHLEQLKHVPENRFQKTICSGLKFSFSRPDACVVLWYILKQKKETLQLSNPKVSRQLHFFKAGVYIIKHGAGILPVH